MAEEGDRPETDLRRRAAWLLVMLVVVAGLFVTIMVFFVGTSPGGKGTQGIGIDDPTSIASSTAATGPPKPAPAGPTDRGRSPSAPTSGSPTNRASPGSLTCPTRKACILPGDAGNLIQAINAMRRQRSQPGVPGTVTAAAQKCALSNGSTCPAGFAETNVPKASGAAAAQKLQSRVGLLDSKLGPISIGWAYDPQAKLYYVVIIVKS